MIMSELSRFTIRTSDRRVFRRCLRKWDWQSSLRQNLQKQGAEQNIHFWFGSAIHFALEDYHTYNKFGDPRRAFKAYYEAFDEDKRPDGSSEAYDIGIGMLTYYLEWLPKHNEEHGFETLWLTEDNKEAKPFSEGAKPATEIQFFLDLDIKVIVDLVSEEIIKEYVPGSDDVFLERSAVFDFATDAEDNLLYHSDGKIRTVKIVPIHYHGTIDRIVTDKYGRWWLLDYKTAKSADTNKLDTDDQINAYLWAMEQYLQHPLYGFIYLQLTKDVPKPPKKLKNGDLSVDKKQKTTYHLVREALIKEFGSIKQAPNKYIDFLNIFAELEFPEGDRFIRWDFVRRSPAQIISTYNHIIGEVRTMINPNLYLYPNPTRDCIWDCPIRDICIAMDDARMEDVLFSKNTEYEKRPRGEDGNSEKWRKNLKYPEDPLKEVTPDEFKLELKDVQLVIENTEEEE
jgi:hypothetical protein